MTAYCEHATFCIVLCAFGGDAGGRCDRGGGEIQWCDPLAFADPPGYCNALPWHPKDVAIMLERTVSSAWRGRYNEVCPGPTRNSAEPSLY